jgi:hypothetical protein
MLQFPLKICHAPTSQYIVLFAPCHSQGTHRPSGNMYNALYHLISKHSSNGIIPEFPGELLVKMFIHKAEEEALGTD